MGAAPEGTGSTGEIPHEHRAQDDAGTAMGSEESNSDEAAHATKPNMDVQEAELLIQKLNKLGHGEQISDQEFLDYYKRLPRPCRINFKVRLEDEELDKQEDGHALYRLRYYKYKFSQQASKEELNGDKLKEDHHPSRLHKSEDDCNEEFRALEEEDELHYEKLKEDRHLSLLHKSEDDCNLEFLEEEDFFRRFEEDETFDWAFHPDYSDCALLNDYQRIVPKQYYFKKPRTYEQYIRRKIDIARVVGILDSED